MSEQDNDIKHLIAQFKSWVECKGLFHAAQMLGHNGTSKVERWVREGRVPASIHVRVIRLIKQDSLWEDRK